MDAIPLGVLIVGTVILLFVAIELGYRAGNLHPESLKKDKEKIASANSTVVLGMLGFILVFTFGIVYSRYDTKRDLVREEANVIRTAWLRSDFLPENDRAEAANLMKRYVDLRIEVSKYYTLEELQRALNELNQIQYRLWNMAVVNARLDMNSDVAAMYIDALNEMFNLQASRIAVGVQARIPGAIWLLLFLLIFLGMFCVGYETSVSGSSRKSFLTPVMALSFSLLIFLIAVLDRPDSSLMRVSQQPVVDMRSWMETAK